MRGFAVFVVSLFFTGTAMAQDVWRDAESVFNTTGKMLDARTILIEIPRSDQTVMKGDVKLSPDFGVTTEIKFTGTPQRATVAAELALLEKEVEPVLAQLQGAGFDITALHNHLFGTDPNILFLHASARGDAKGLATALKSALALTGTPVGSATAPAASTTSTQWTTLQNALGLKGEQKADVLEMLIPRKEKVTLKGKSVPPFFGAAHHLEFQKTGDKVVTTGELVLLDSEVNPVAKVLKANRFDITALHNHELFDNPRLFYLHFWANDTPDAIGKTLRRALGMTAGVGAASVPTGSVPTGSAAPGSAPTGSAPGGEPGTSTYPLPGGTPPIPPVTTPKH